MEQEQTPKLPEEPKLVTPLTTQITFGEPKPIIKNDV